MFSIYREWITDSKKCEVYFLSSYKVLGITILKVKRNNHRTIYFCGVPIYKSLIYKITETEKVANLLEATVAHEKIPKASGLLRTLQLAGLELLKKINKVCQKYGISYWLDFGTMLGAIRHKGFIPWDDDIDIAMLRTDFEKFLAIYKDEFPESTYSINYQGFLQIHIKDTLVQVDIFPYDQASESWFPEGEKEHSFCQKLCLAASQLKYNIQLGKDSLNGIANKDYQEIKQLYTSIVLDNKAPIKNGNICKAIEVPVGGRYSIKHEWIFPLQFTHFESESFPIPNFPEPILFSNYGNWEKIPRNPYFHFDLKKITKSQYIKLLSIIKGGI